MTAALAPGTVCPYCRAGFEPDEQVLRCPACTTPHHADCFAENGGCTIFGCTAAPADDPGISVTTTELHTTPRPNPTPAPLQPGWPPPPPMPAGAVPPPPRPVAFGYPGPYAVPSYYPAYGDFYPRPKSRVTFVLLAVFLGLFGAHNFYAGYNKKAALQLCLSVCTCFYASPVSWIWAIVEACTTTIDDDGVLLG